MKYLSFDIEATGLDEHDLIIEFAMIPFCSETKTMDYNLAKHFYVKCPSFEVLKPKLNPWVIEHNQTLIEKAHSEGIEISEFKNEMIKYLSSNEVKKYFNGEKIPLFGKSMNAIDLPFLNRDLGYSFMRDYFHHRVLDLTCVVLGLIDLKILPPETKSGSELMKYLGLGDVKHTALEDAINTVKMYFIILEKNQKS